MSLLEELLAYCAFLIKEFSKWGMTEVDVEVDISSLGPL